MASLSKSVIGSSAEERELQICRLGWSLLLLWLIMIIYMTKALLPPPSTFIFIIFFSCCPPSSFKVSFLSRNPLPTERLSISDSHILPKMDNFCDRLYVGGFSTNLCSDQIRLLISQAASPFEVNIEIVENGSRRHRGFAFVQCRNTAEANLLMTKFSSLFNKVNFAKREPKVAENVMSNISNVFVRGISREMSDTELYQAFGGVSDGVVQCHVADGYGFVLFDTRANAQKKITEMDGSVVNGKSISVSWARPDTLGRKRKRPEMEIASPSPTLDYSSLLKRPVIPSHLFHLPPPQPSSVTLPPSLFPILNPTFPLLFPQNPMLAAPSDLTSYLNMFM